MFQNYQKNHSIFEEQNKRIANTPLNALQDGNAKLFQYKANKAFLLAWSGISLQTRTLVQ